MSDNCLFCKIVEGSIPCTKVYEDDDFLAFNDINPAAPVHILVVPKQHVHSLQTIHAEDAVWLGKMLALAPEIARLGGCRPGHEGGFRVVINSGLDGGQEINHLHMHVLGGERPWQSRAAPAA